MSVYKLYDLAAVIRSKNSGPFQITLDVLFDDKYIYEKIRDQGIITKEKIADAPNDVIVSEESKDVRDAILSLPENLRLALQLKEFSGLDYKAIGRILGISETNVKVRIHRARKKLEQTLGKEDRDVY